MDEARQAGAEVAKHPQDVFWGGYSGYFRDPDGHLWELVHNPFVACDETGGLTLPD
ncbi:VOC family protein [Desulfohalovibrio reitneri]|uniref:VOC family protein n=1 Tax=Desulfohalovibrio reitneri TaxID=1307759 RepID=UPI000A965DEF|nr:VOC family protein [Desulfohalovibrio reitneri]